MQLVWILYDQGKLYENRGLFSRDGIHLSEEKHFCQQDGQSSNESFKLGIKGAGENDQQSSEKVKDQDSKQRVQGNMNRRKLVSKKTGL